MICATLQTFRNVVLQCSIFFVALQQYLVIPGIVRVFVRTLGGRSNPHRLIIRAVYIYLFGIVRASHLARRIGLQPRVQSGRRCSRSFA